MIQIIQYIKNYSRYSAIMALLIVFTACKKFVELDPPQDQIVSSVVFSTDEAATAAVVGIYSDMMLSSSRFTAGETTFYAGMSADELSYYTPGPRDEFIKNEITEASHATIFGSFWERAYRFIYTANLCLEQLEKSNQLTPETKSMLIGECKFIRAFCYFYLVNLFGDVPFTTTSDYRINSELPRARVDTIYKKMISDLKDAKQLLSPDYATVIRVRPNKWAAAALLARVYLYNKEWANAEIEAGSVINEGPYPYRLVSLDSVFLKSSNEAIWQLLPVNTANNNTWEGNSIIQSGTPTYLLTDTLIKSFEPGDQRQSNWTKSRLLAGETLIYPYKYKVKSHPTQQIEYYIVLRLAEQYLIRAEARANQNKLTEAIADIDMIRSRAGLAGTTANSISTILTAIEQERKIELFAEWGNRWFDLKRTGRATDVLPSSKPDAHWDSKDQLWPIPNSQLLANPGWKQNPGY